MNLDLDAGNSFVKWRCGDRSGRLETARADAAQFARAWGELSPRRVRLASVASEGLDSALATFVAGRWGLALETAVTQACQGGVTNSYRDPSRMGVDRWLAMLAGYHRTGGACCVVDCGSAITVDHLAADGHHLGGYIMPGLRLMRESLVLSTQRVKPQSQTLPNRITPGRSTEEAVDHGIHLMLAALAQRVLADTGHLLGPDARLLVTGGDGPQFLHFAGAGALMSENAAEPFLELVPDLVLDGLEWALP